ncbi:MAG: C39 family peptidase [Planctomycetota bacterium]
MSSRLCARRAALLAAAPLLLASVLAAGCSSSGGSAGDDRLADTSADGTAASDPIGRIGDPLHASVPEPLRPEGPWLESGDLSTDAPFTEALPSWNVSGDAPFVVDVRVSADESGDAWSPWMRIGDWGIEAREAAVVTSFEGGEIKVDVLELESPHRRAQLRFGRADLSAPLDPADVRAFLVLSDLSGLGDRLARCAAEPWPAAAQLRVPARSQRRAGDDIAHRVCSPTSVAMVAAFHGASVTTRDMAATILDPHFDIYGNWNRAVQGAFSYGVPGRLVRVSSWETVRAHLADGRPLVASIRAREGELNGAPYTSTSGHLLVVTGLGPRETVFVNDPAASWPGSVPRRYTRAEMENVWFGRGGVAYAFEPVPEGERASE